MRHMQASRCHGTHQVTEGQKPKGEGKRWRTVQDHSEKAGMVEEEGRRGRVGWGEEEEKRVKNNEKT